MSAIEVKANPICSHVIANNQDTMATSDNFSDRSFEG